MSNRKKATKEAKPRKMEEYLNDKYGEAECEEGRVLHEETNVLHVDMTQIYIDEIAKLKAELAELKKGEVELEAWYLVDNDGEECARWLSEYKQWHAYPSMGFIGIFEDYTIKERLYKASEVSGE